MEGREHKNKQIAADFLKLVSLLDETGKTDDSNVKNNLIQIIATLSQAIKADPTFFKNEFNLKLSEDDVLKCNEFMFHYDQALKVKVDSIQRNELLKFFLSVDFKKEKALEDIGGQHTPKTLNLSTYHPLYSLINLYELPQDLLDCPELFELFNPNDFETIINRTDIDLEVCFKMLKLFFELRKNYVLMPPSVSHEFLSFVFDEKIKKSIHFLEKGAISNFLMLKDKSKDESNLKNFLDQLLLLSAAPYESFTDEDLSSKSQLFKPKEKKMKINEVRKEFNDYLKDIKSAIEDINRLHKSEKIKK